MLYSGRLLRQIASLLAMASCAAGADYVGSQACARCHAAIYRSFQRTPMAQSSGRVGTSDTPETFDRAEFPDSRGAFVYRVSREAGSYFFEFREQGAKPGIQGRRRMDYFVGSGAAARSYLMSVDGFLYEAPVSYYRNSASWNPAPGYAPFDYPYLTRPIQPGCLGCHASGIQRTEGAENAYASPPFREGGVACERCHGPGSDHIATRQPMVNPAKLKPAERDSVCEQCHLSGEIRFARQGKDELAFRAGNRLADFIAVFVRSGVPSEMRVTSHAENLAASMCKKASGDRMWCGTCHDPHTVPPAAEKAAYFRAKCLTCHKTSDCGAAQATRQANGDDCVTCHMPHRPPSDVEHVIFTDHSIRRHPTPVILPAAAPAANADLVPFRGGEVSTREQGLAYAMLGLRDGNSAYIERAFRLLQQTVAGGNADAQTLAYLAQFYRDRKDDAHALPLYQQAWRLDHAQSAVAAALGAYAMQAGTLEEAIGYWNLALGINPALVLVRANLATALLRVGRREQAQATLQKALEFNPSFRVARDMLAKIGN